MSKKSKREEKKLLQQKIQEKRDYARRLLELGHVDHEHPYKIEVCSCCCVNYAQLDKEIKLELKKDRKNFKLLRQEIENKGYTIVYLTGGGYRID